MLPTRFCDLVGCERPLQLAGMGGTTNLGLAAAVSRAGGLGMIPGGRGGTAELEGALAALGDQTSGPVGVNFLVPFSTREEFEVAASAARVVEWFWGVPDASFVAISHSAGALAGWQVGSVIDARRAVDAGCDYVVLQGMEAGGHVAGRQSLWALLGAASGVIDVPIVAAGGLGNAHGVAELLGGAEELLGLRR